MRSLDYELMLKDQKGHCAICKEKLDENKRLDIDHDHNTGEVRGLLCMHCNLLIGHARDNPEILRQAAKYLDKGGHPSRFFVEGGRLITS